jgi:hypothetical protein
MTCEMPPNLFAVLLAMLILCVGILGLLVGMKLERGGKHGG